MEVRDGFIEGIFNYCDRWCERCKFTSHCRLFADHALLAIERSHGAWLELVDRGIVSSGEVDPFIADLVWLGEALERVRPRARAFVRAGLDEPEAIARLVAEQGGQR